MSISEPFIRRPVATSLLMVGVISLGLLGYELLPISALPTVDFPTIEVTTFYPGASADVMVSSITTPLERQFGQISGLASMNSNSSFGTSTITLQFVLDRPIDVAAQDVQAAINVAGGFLPKDLPNPPKYNKVNPADTPILTLSITSDSLPLDRVNDYTDSLLAQKLSEVTGVGLVTIEGNQKPAVRVQVNPAAISALGLSLEDVRTILGQANVNAPKGSFDGPRQASPLVRMTKFCPPTPISRSSLLTKTALLFASATSPTSSTASRTISWPRGWAPKMAINPPCYWTFSGNPARTSSKQSRTLRNCFRA